MHMNIYISPANEQKLRNHNGSMSGLVNNLLTEFFLDGKEKIELREIEKALTGKQRGTQHFMPRQTVEPASVRTSSLPEPEIVPLDD
jgi:hypothetical protein